MGKRILYNTSWTLRSAVSQFYTWDLQIAYRGQAIRDSQCHGHLMEHCLPSDELRYSLMSSGMACQMGDNSKPSITLNHSQVLKIVGFIEQVSDCPLTLGTHQDLAAVAMTHIGIYLSWLHSNEFFSLDWEDITVTPQERHLEKGLPQQSH